MAVRPRRGAEAGHSGRTRCGWRFGRFRSKQQRYKDAYPIATQLTGSLGLMGFRLNLQVEGTTSYEDLLALAPKIRAAVGAEKAAALDKALND
jgi:hypothetical protein